MKLPKHLTIRLPGIPGRKPRQEPLKVTGPRPDQLLLRKRHILAWIDLNTYYLEQVIAAGLLPFKRLEKARWSLRDDVERVFVKKFRKSE
jgi:hypothetical protein